MFPTSCHGYLDTLSSTVWEAQQDLVKLRASASIRELGHAECWPGSREHHRHPAVTRTLGVGWGWVESRQHPSPDRKLMILRRKVPMPQGPPAHCGEPRASSPSSELVLTLSSVPSHSSWSDSCLWTCVHHSCPDSGPPPTFYLPQCFSRPPEADPHRLNPQVVKRQWEHQRWDKKEVGHFCPTSVILGASLHFTTLLLAPCPLRSPFLQSSGDKGFLRLQISRCLTPPCQLPQLCPPLPKRPCCSDSFLNDLSWILISTRALMHISSLCADLFIHYLIL